MTEYRAGVMPGLGTKSAVVLVQAEPGDQEAYTVRALLWGAASLTYAEQALGLAWLLSTVPENCTVYLNLTSLGALLLEVYQARLDWRRVSLIGCVVTEDATCERNSRPAILGSGYLLGRLILLAQVGALHLPDTPEGQMLLEALAALRPGLALPGGERDTLLLAFGLAVGMRSSGAGVLMLDVDPFDPTGGEAERPDRTTNYRAYLRHVRGY